MTNGGPKCRLIIDEICNETFKVTATRSRKYLKI